MSSKPSTVASWATDGSSVAPSGGQQVTGFTNGQVPTSGLMDWLFNISSLWQQYLSDGALTGPISVSGTFTSTSSHEIAISPAAFVFDINNTNIDTLHPDYRTNASGASTGYAALTMLRVGDIITRYQSFYSVVGGSMQPAIRRINLAAGTDADVWIGVTDNTGSSIESQDSNSVGTPTPLSHTVASGYIYYAQMLHTSAFNQNRGGIITFTRTTA